MNRISRLLNLENPLDDGKLAKLPSIKISRDPQLHTKRPHVASQTQGWQTLALEPWLCPNVAPLLKSSLKNRVFYSLRELHKTQLLMQREWSWLQGRRRLQGEREGRSSEHRQEKEFREERARERQSSWLRPGESTCWCLMNSVTAPHNEIFIPGGWGRGTWQSPGVSRHGWKIEIPLSPVGSPSLSCLGYWLGCQRAPHHHHHHFSPPPPLLLLGRSRSNSPSHSCISFSASSPAHCNSRFLLFYPFSLSFHRSSLPHIVVTPFSPHAAQLNKRVKIAAAPRKKEKVNKWLLSGERRRHSASTNRQHLQTYLVTGCSDHYVQ